MPSDEPRRRRAVRPAGTVGGDEANLRSSFPAPVSAPDEPGAPLPGAGFPAGDQATPADAASSGEPRRPRRAPDDEDVGWGARVDDSNDERLTRERPPHW